MTAWIRMGVDEENVHSDVKIQKGCGFHDSGILARARGNAKVAFVAPGVVPGTLSL